MTEYGLTRKELRFLKQRNKHIELSSSPLTSIFTRLSIPAFIGFLATSLYSVADSIYIGQGVGNIGLTGMSLFSPIEVAVITPLSYLCTGAASGMASIRLGQGDLEGAETYLMYYVMITLMLCSLIVVCFVPSMYPLLEALGARGEVLKMTYPYGLVITINSYFIGFNNGLGPFMRMENKPIESMMRLVIIALLNIAIDPILVFVAHLELLGVSLATLISNVVVVTYFLVWYIKPTSSATLHMKGKYLKCKSVKWKEVGKLIGLSIGPGLSSCISSLSTVFVNMQLNRFTDPDDPYLNAYISGYGVVSRVVSLISTSILGVSQAVTPIFGYNQGQKNWIRAYNSLVVGVFWIILLSLIIQVIIIALAQPVAKIFNTDELFLEVTPNIMRLAMAGTFSTGISTMASNIYIIERKTLLSSVCGLLKGVIMIICIYVLPTFIPDKYLALWLATPIADYLAFIIIMSIFCPYIGRYKKKSKEQLDEMEGEKPFQYTFCTMFRCMECCRTKEQKRAFILAAMAAQEEHINNMDEIIQQAEISVSSAGSRTAEEEIKELVEEERVDSTAESKSTESSAE